jgi:hypothetical protein
MVVLSRLFSRDFLSASLVGTFRCAGFGESHQFDGRIFRLLANFSCLPVLVAPPFDSPILADPISLMEGFQAFSLTFRAFGRGSLLRRCRSVRPDE